MEIKIKINGQSWRVEVVSIKKMKEEAEDKDTLGLCVVHEKTIYIREDSVDYGTIAHELFHAFVADLCLSDTANIGLEDLEEIFAQHFESRGETIVKKAKQVNRELQKLLAEREE